MSLEVEKVGKAIAGAIAAVLAGMFARWMGAQYTPEIDGAIRVLVDMITTFVIGYVIVYIAPKNKE